MVILWLRWRRSSRNEIAVLLFCCSAVLVTIRPNENFVFHHQGVGVANRELVASLVSPHSGNLTFAANGHGRFTAALQLYNRGNLPIGLQSVSSTCNCTRVVSAPAEIPAGETVELKIEVNPAKASQRTIWYDVSTGVVRIRGTFVLKLVSSGRSTGTDLKVAFSGEYQLPFRILESDLELSPVDVNGHPVSKLIPLVITDELLSLRMSELPHAIDAGVEKVGNSTCIRMVVNVDALVAKRPGKSVVPISVMLLATTDLNQQVVVPVTFQLPLRHPVTLAPQRLVAAPVEPSARYAGEVRVLVNRAVTGPICEIVRRDNSGDIAKDISMDYRIESDEAVVSLHFQAAANEGVSHLQLPLQIRCSNNDYELQVPITTVVRRKVSL